MRKPEDWGAEHEQRPTRGSGEERARQRAIREVDLEDARPVFERIARTARRLTGAPVAHVSIICTDQIWIAGRLGRRAAAAGGRASIRS